MALISQAPAALDLVAVKADDFNCTFTITNQGSLQDWTGVTVTTTIWDDGVASPVTFTVTTPSAGRMVLALSDTQTSTLGVGVWRYSVTVTTGTNSRTWLAGSLQIMEPGWAGSSTTTASLTITTGAATISIGGALSNAGGALGNYGAFSDYNDQLLVTAGVAKVMTFGTVDGYNQVSMVSSSRLTFAQPGTYNVQWSGQFENANAADLDAQVWVRKNGVDVVGSTGLVSIPGKHGAINGHALPAWNYIFTLAANDYLELVWTADSTDVSIQTSAAAGVWPSTASLIVTATPVMFAQQGLWETPQTVVTQTGTTYTILSADAGKFLQFSNASAVTVTVPAGVGWPVGTRLDFAQTGVGKVTLVASGVTINSASTLFTRTRYSAATLLCTATDTYLLLGDLGA